MSEPIVQGFYQKEYTIDGETLPLAAWARRYGMNPTLVRDRVRYCHWPLMEALTQPPLNNTTRIAYRRNHKCLGTIAAAFKPKTIKLLLPVPAKRGENLA